MPPRTRADLSGYGYSGNKSVDDLSGQAAQDWEVDHDLDDGYPDTVSFVSGTSVPEFTTELAGRAPATVALVAASSWSAQVTNGAAGAFAATLTIPTQAAGGPVPGEWIVVSVSVRDTAAVIACNDDLFDQATLGSDVNVQTATYVRQVSTDLATSGASVVFSWPSAAGVTQYTILAAGVGIRDGRGMQVGMRLAQAVQQAETGVAGTSHSAPPVTVAPAAAKAPTEAGLIVSVFARGSAGSANWTAPTGDGELRDTVGANGAVNVNASISYDMTLRTAGTYTKTATSGTSTAEVTMTSLLFTAIVWNQLRGTEYWSPLRADSPLYGVERDLPGVTLDTGLVTASGPEYVRIFTGQMVNTPVKDGKAALKAMSATRIALMRQVLPPAFPANHAGGLRASWPVSWALAQAGIYAGPKPRAGYTTLYYPNHGSLRRFLTAGYPGGNQTGTGQLDRWTSYEVTAAGAQGQIADVGWIDGPYVAAPDLQLRTALSRRAYQLNPPFHQEEGQPSALTQVGHKGRLEAWVRGDAADYNTAPGGSGGVSALMKLQMVNLTASGSAQMGIDTARRVYITVNDGAGTRTLTGSTLPTDGAWHFVGAAYDFDSDKLWTCLDNTVTSASASLVTTNLPTSGNSFNTTSTFILSYLPFSDFTFSTGAQANPDDFPVWRNAAAFAPTARVGLSVNALLAMAEDAPREAWELIAGFAQAELAAMRCNELDEFEYLPPGWWVRDDQQAVVDELTTGLNASAFNVDLDPSRIRNTVTVSYSEATLPTYSTTAGTYRRTYEMATNIEVPVPPGLTTLRITFGSPVVVLNQTIQALTDITAPLTAAADPNTSYATYNLSADGTGPYTTGSITAAITAWDAGGVTIQFTNISTFTYYLANDVNVPALVLTGIPVTMTQTYAADSDAASVALRNERGLSVSAPGVQTSAAARRLARNLVSNLRLPMATIGDDSSGITVTADPRRQPGDLVGIEDTETGVTGDLWRLQSVRHAGSGAAYTQQVVARRVFPICIVGEGLVGRSLVGPAE